MKRGDLLECEQSLAITRLIARDETEEERRCLQRAEKAHRRRSMTPKRSASSLKEVSNDKGHFTASQR